jgi:hypothetical protein
VNLHAKKHIDTCLSEKRAKPAYILKWRKYAPRTIWTTLFRLSLAGCAAVQKVVGLLFDYWWFDREQWIILNTREYWEHVFLLVCYSLLFVLPFVNMDVSRHIFSARYIRICEIIWVEGSNLSVETIYITWITINARIENT